MTKNPLFRLLLINGLAGAALGVAFVAGVIALDVAGIRTLLVQTGDWAVALSMLVIGCVSTFASVTMGSAIMMTARDSQRPPAGGKPLTLVPVRQEAVIRRRR